MAKNDSTRGMVLDVIPDDTENADFPVQITDIVNAIEPKLVLRASTLATANSTLTPLEDGMMLVTTSTPKEVYVRQAGAWTKIYPNQYAGTTVPAASLGINGDVYFQYSA